MPERLYSWIRQLVRVCARACVSGRLHSRIRQLLHVCVCVCARMRTRVGVGARVCVYVCMWHHLISVVICVLLCTAVDCDSTHYVPRCAPSW